MRNALVKLAPTVSAEARAVCDALGAPPMPDLETIAAWLRGSDRRRREDEEAALRAERIAERVGVVGGHSFGPELVEAVIEDGGA